MHLNPYIYFPGNCAEALAFYEKTLGAQILSTFRFGDSPMAEKMPDWADKVMHATFKVGDSHIMASDAPPEHYSAPAGFAIHIPATSITEAERLFNGLSEGGTVTMPLQKTFWAVRFGMFKDRFGIPWMINCDKE